ncbi:MAG: hypothetical protein PWQ43_758, partial [Rikenellaceae bacterium]|nr:hypothetical protein [Rikenellaceae bacterium]
MKEILNVKKSEAKQIGLWGICILDSKSNYLMISRDGCFTFEYFCGSKQDVLNYEGEYKKYEWRLTDLKKLKHGDVCRVEY